MMRVGLKEAWASFRPTLIITAFLPDEAPQALRGATTALKKSGMTHKLLALVEREQVALVVFGHDSKQWQTLKKLPEYYD